MLLKIIKELINNGYDVISCRDMTTESLKVKLYKDDYAVERYVPMSDLSVSEYLSYFVVKELLRDMVAEFECIIQ